LEHNTNKPNLWDRIMMAITFAEAGEEKTAIELLDKKTNEQRSETRIRKTEQRPELRV
jgi:hypothetical protein